MADWAAIKGEYITTSISCNKLATKYGLSCSTVLRKCKSEGWKEQKDEFCKKMQEKKEEIVTQHEVDRIQRLLNLSDKLADKLEKAIDEIDQYKVTSKKKSKVKTLKKDSEGNNVEIEKLIEDEEVKASIGPIDKIGLRQLTAALKDIKDIQVDLGANDEQVEGSGLIEILMQGVPDLFDDGDDSDLLPEDEDGGSDE